MKKNNLFSFLDSIDNYIHPEVLKLYPEAELPKFNSEIISDTEMRLHYFSKRKMAHFAVGLIKSSANYFKNNIDVIIEEEKKDGEEVLMKVMIIG